MKSVLIVDDDPTIRATLETLLRTVLNVEVSSADSARDALRWLDSYPTDLIITDLCMPGVSGANLISRIREKGITTPVIVISGFLRDFEDEKRWRKDGVVAVLEKPFGMQELVDAVIPVLGESCVAAA
jgi:two-component system, response regulator YesN